MSLLVMIQPIARRNLAARWLLLPSLLRMRILERTRRQSRLRKRKVIRRWPINHYSFPHRSQALLLLMLLILILLFPLFFILILIPPHHLQADLLPRLLALWLRAHLPPPVTTKCIPQSLHHHHHHHCYQKRLW